MHDRTEHTPTAVIQGHTDHEAPCLAADTCNDWCAVREQDHEEYRDPHSGAMSQVELWGSSGLENDLFVHLRRPYVAGLPMQDVPDRHTSVVVCVGDDDPVLSMPAAVARSLATALLRAAERAETAVSRRA